jgi:hypothetical protein
MSGYLGSKRAVNFATVQLPIKSKDMEIITEHGAIAQRNSIPEAVTIDEGTNVAFYGDVTFDSLVTVNGNLIVIGGDIDFKGGADIVGKLIYR